MPTVQVEAQVSLEELVKAAEQLQCEAAEAVEAARAEHEATKPRPRTLRIKPKGARF